MILDTIKIENFRQYYDNQTIKISKDPQKNVTVIHGENGEGKTAFLNLIKWCLYEKIYLPESHRLLNEKAEAELEEGQYKEVSIEITFDDRNYKYIVKRAEKYKKENGKIRVVKHDFTVSSIDDIGKTITYENPQNTINQVLPENMESYFFFDGERIDNLAKIESSSDIKQAIENIMGIEVIKNAINDLDEACTKLRKDFSKATTNKEVEKYNDQLNTFKSELVMEQGSKNQLETNKRYLANEKESIYDRLKSLEGAKELQKQREWLESERNKVIKKIEELNMSMKRAYSSKGYLAFTDLLINNVGTILDERRLKGEIPAGIKEQFVDDLLERKLCICGRDLMECSVEYNNVHDWKKKSGNTQLENAFIKMSSDLKLISKEKDSLFNTLERIKKEKKDAVDNKKKIDEQLDEVTSKLDSKDSEDIQVLEQRRKDVDERMSKIDAQIGQRQYVIQKLIKDISELEGKIVAASAEEGKSKIAKHRLQCAEDARDTLVDIFEITTETVRIKLQDKIDNVYENFSKKGYKPVLNEDFTLQIVKENDPYKRPVPMSQGERQITSLCFIGALLDIARDRTNHETQFFKGGIYPIVMDSPFGALDPEHKKKVALGMPNLSQQIVILVTNSQWKGEVEESIFNRIGRSYHLVNYNPKKDPNVKYEYTVLREG